MAISVATSRRVTSTRERLTPRATDPPTPKDGPEEGASATGLTLGVGGDASDERVVGRLDEPGAPDVQSDDDGGERDGRLNDEGEDVG